jgi:hypothetical protein
MTNITMINITQLANISEPTDLIINVNNTIYGGWLIFILLCVTWFVFFRLAQAKDNQPLPNLAMSGAIITILSILLRFIYVIREGVWQGLLTESQFWIFPILTILFAMIAWMSKE